MAIATAWSGDQATLWTGHQSELYGRASKLRIEAEGATSEANQERLYNALTVVEWLKAEANDDKKLTTAFEGRVLPWFRPAFQAWKKADPLQNPDAPAGPRAMPEYRSSRTEAAAALNGQAAEKFQPGTEATRHSDQYVRARIHNKGGLTICSRRCFFPRAIPGPFQSSLSFSPLVQKFAGHNIIWTLIGISFRTSEIVVVFRCYTGEQNKRRPGPRV